MFLVGFGGCCPSILASFTSRLYVRPGLHLAIFSYDFELLMFEEFSHISIFSHY
jgi:hypothetical protein